LLSELLRAVLLANCDYGTERYQVEKAIKNSAEWIAFLKQLTKYDRRKSPPPAPPIVPVSREKLSPENERFLKRGFEQGWKIPYAGPVQYAPPPSISSRAPEQRKGEIPASSPSNGTNFGGTSRSKRAGKNVTANPMELGKGGVTFVRHGEHTVAKGSTQTPRHLHKSYPILCEELTKVSAIVKAANGSSLTGKELRNEFRSSALGKIADQDDWDRWALDFSQTNQNCGTPKGVALVFLERKTKLARGTIKSYLSRARKPTKR
jgi:hypothetical protein